MRVCELDGCSERHRSKGLCTKHYMARLRDNPRSKTYNIWYMMLRRCNAGKGYFHKYYNLRGITVCDEWQSFDGFVADMGYQPEGMTLDRIDNNKGYRPDNCRWVTMAVQNNNKSNNRFITIDGQRKTVTQWADLVGTTTVKWYLWKYGEQRFISRVRELLA